MEGIREAALAYYEPLPAHLRVKAFPFYSWKIRKLTEFEEITKQMRIVCKNKSKDKFFKELHKNEDGTLRFEEFLTLFYVCMSGRLIFCEGCGVFLKGLYFTCLECFHGCDTKYISFNLCSSCYSNGHYHVLHGLDGRHKKTPIFLDNYTLLHSKSHAFHARLGSYAFCQPSKASSQKEELKDILNSCVRGVYDGYGISQVCSTM